MSESQFDSWNDMGFQLESYCVSDGLTLGTNGFTVTIILRDE